MCSRRARAGCALLLLAVLAGCGARGHTHTGADVSARPAVPGPAPASGGASEAATLAAPNGHPPARRDRTPTIAQPAAGGQSPIDVAMHWLTAYRQASWTDPATAWIARVQPYVTGRMAATNQSLAGHSGGAGWAHFVADRCTVTVTHLGGVIPPEAPRTSHAVHVQVAGELHTRCAAGTSPGPELVAATVTVVLTPTGWRVDRREQ